MGRLLSLFTGNSPRNLAGYLVVALLAQCCFSSANAGTCRFNGGDGGSVNGMPYYELSSSQNIFITSGLKLSHTNSTLKCAGWWFDLNGQRTAKVNETIYINWGSLTAKWVEDRYPVFFVSNFTSPKTNEQWVVASEKMTLAPNSFSRSGYRFAGWSTDKTAKIPMWSDGQANVNLDQYRDKYDVVHKDEYDCAVFPVTLYAVWERQFTVKFAKNGGTGSMDDLLLNDGETRNLPKCGFTPPVGRKFDYWSSTIGSYQDEDEITYNSSQWQGTVATFTAQWTPVSYKVRFLPNSPDPVSGAMSDQAMDYGVPQNLKGCAFQRTGYRFAGWAESADGAVKYADKADVVNLSSTDGAVVELYAKWDPIRYAVKFDSAGGEGEMAVLDCEYGRAYVLPANSFRREGGMFRGWATNGVDTVIYGDRGTVSNLSTVAGSTNVFRAVWSNIAYHLAFDANGGEGEMATIDCEYGTVYQLPSNDFSRTGYVFTGWTTNAALPAAFAEGAFVSNLTVTADATVGIFAAWRPVNYRIVFDANGGEGEMTSMDCVYDVGYSLRPNSFTRLGRAFSGWASEPGGAVIYTDGDSVMNLVTVDGGEYPLYAVWIKELSPLNSALDNGDLTMLADGGTDSYVAVFDDASAVNGTCVRINRYSTNRGESGFRVYLDDPGDITFAWKVVNVTGGRHRDGWQVKVHLEDSDTTNDVLFVNRGSDYEEPDLDWQDLTVSVSNTPAALQFVFSGLSGNGSTELYALFDNVRWTSSANPEPTPEDAPVINGAAAVEGGRFRVTFAADKRFKYELIRNETLAPSDWRSFDPQLFLSPDADGSISFEPEMEASKSRMFYRVRVLKKD